MAKKNEAAPTINVGVLDDGTIAMQFSERIKQMTFSPAQAKSLGMGLIEMGTRGESLQRIAPQSKRVQ